MVFSTKDNIIVERGATSTHINIIFMMSKSTHNVNY